MSGNAQLRTLLTIISHILQFQLVYRLWTLVIIRFMSALQDLRPNCRHQRFSFHELAPALHFSHGPTTHTYGGSDDFNLRLVKDRQRCAQFWRCSCCHTD